MAKRFPWVFFSTFLDLRDYLRKGTSRVFFFASFSNSLNMEKMLIFMFIGLVKISNNNGLFDHHGLEPLLLRVCAKGFIRRMNL